MVLSKKSVLCILTIFAALLLAACTQEPASIPSDTPVDLGIVNCEEPRPEVCTEQYDPVCAEVDTGIRCVTEPCPSTEWKTYGNACGACADPNVYGYIPGACESELPQEPEPTQKFEALCDSAPEWVRENEELTAQFNCVESCPQESYSTQIGLEVCIDLLDKEYFESLPTCERSSSSCDCILPTSTTDSQEIDVGFRCVDHENYKHRMIFYGLTRVDENGETSTIIA